MTPTFQRARTAWSLSAAFLLAVVLAAPAGASVSSEQQQGSQVLSAVHAGTVKGKSLSGPQYEHVGEYLMGQALGSTTAHERMNSLMDQMMGSAAADQMHTYLGERYLGHSSQIATRYAPMYGLIGMMMSYRGSSLAAMMSGFLNGHNAGAATTGSPMMGNAVGTTANSEGGWPTGAILAIAVLAALLIAGTATLAVPMLRRGHTTSP